MAIQNYQIFTKPNKWLEPKYSRPFYDIFNRETGKKYRIAASELWNSPDRLIPIFGKDTRSIVDEIIKREKEIESLKEKYLEMYESVKSRYDSGMRIPKSWMVELEDLFDQMYQKDTSLGEFSQPEDTMEAVQEKEKLMSIPPIMNESHPKIGRKPAQAPMITSSQSGQMKGRNPDTEAPHMTTMPNIHRRLSDDDRPGNNMELSAKKLSRKCEVLLDLAKEEMSTMGPAAVSTVGYMNPRYDAPAFAAKKKKKKTKQFMKADGFVGNIEDLTNRNDAFRRVMYTGEKSQLVLMNLKPGEEIGEEVHEDTDQFFRVDSGVGMVVIDDKRYKIKDGTGIVVPAGAKHNVKNISKDQELKLYSIYSPPEHKDKIVRQTKEEAEKKKEHFDGTTTE